MLKCFLKMSTSNKTNSQKSSEIAKKLSNETTKLIFKSRPKLTRIVQRSDKINSKKSSNVAKSCPTKRQNKLPKSSENAKKLSTKCRDNIATNVYVFMKLWALETVST